MGREVRRVPKDWQHPRMENRNRYQPLENSSYEEAKQEWITGFIEWHIEGNPEDEGCDYWEYCGNPPDRNYHMPDWDESERTHYQMYENTTEGTPISPVMETPEELARWCADNRVSAFADMTADYEHWLRVAKGGWAPSLIVQNGVMKSGVHALPCEDSVDVGENAEEDND
jgi:hypothetical protein